jgi:hypothetical protein
MAWSFILRGVKGTGFTSYRNDTLNDTLDEGHGFSRAALNIRSERASAPEVRFSNDSQRISS